MLIPSLKSYVETLFQGPLVIPQERMDRLKAIRQFVKNQNQSSLLFVCTHNSRRSHMGQIWAACLAHHFGEQKVECYSGGTEATAFHPNAKQAMERAGFQIQTLEQGPNPRYGVVFGTNGASVKVWSKVYTNPANPSSDFCAIMTCDEADKACPNVFGAAERIALPYSDPKIADGTADALALYEQRSQQIARELMEVFLV